MVWPLTFTTNCTLRGFFLVIFICVFPFANAEVASGSGAVIMAGGKVIPKSASSPRWNELSLAQQQALAPLAGEWDKLNSPRKNKWLQISSKFSKLTPDQQQRVQDRMREWAKLTPEQRRVARENYSRSKKIAPIQKSEKWQQYQQLPAAQKDKLAADAPVKKQITNLPSPLQSKGKTVPPIKLIGKPMANASSVPLNLPASAPQSKMQQPPAESSPLQSQPIIK